MAKAIASDATKEQVIGRTVLQPARTWNARDMPLKYDDYVTAQVIKNAPTKDTKHTINGKLVAEDDHDVAIWGFLITQYGLKTGLQKFVPKGDKAAGQGANVIITRRTN